MSGTSSYDEDVFTGVWINHSYGRFKGATLTLDRQQGAFLIAFLALYVGATGRSFWRIVRFILHTFLSSESSADGLHHQRQAILRNSPLPQDAAMDMVQARFAWRKRSKDVDSRSWPIVLVASSVTAAFAIAGIFSSNVAKGHANEVLISGQHCGNMTGEMPQGADQQANVWTDYYSARTQKATEYLSYAYNCYQNRSASKTKDCNTYTKAALSYTKKIDADCPFDPEMCLLLQGNLWLDSGMLDSRTDFGLNSGPHFQLQLDRHCAPLVTQNFSKIQEDKTDPSTKWMEYYYGPSGGFGGGTHPYSFKLRYNTSATLDDYEQLMNGDGYTVTSAGNVIDYIPQLLRNGSELALMWLQSSNIKNYAKVNDPWFKATEAREVPAWIRTGLGLVLPDNKYFVAEEPAGVLGCTTTFKLCNPNMPEDKRCKFPHLPNVPWSDVWPDKAERIVMMTISEYIYHLYDGLGFYPQVYYIIKGLPSLTTRFTLNGLLQPAQIPDNRWQQETEYMFQTNLAALQGQLVELATGRIPPEREALGTLCAYTVECNRLCHSQKIRSSSYYSFSMLGISIILVFGAVILLIGTYIEPSFFYVCKLLGLSNNRRLHYARVEWQAGATLQLHRLAHEGVGSGTWSGADKAMPVTEAGDRLAVLDMSDPKHPRLAGARELRDSDMVEHSSSERFMDDDLKTPTKAKFNLGVPTEYKRISSSDRM